TAQRWTTTYCEADGEAAGRSDTAQRWTTTYCEADGEAAGRSDTAQRWTTTYIPIGCQTVLSSRNAAMSYGLCESARPRTIRFTFSAPSFSSSAASPSAPVRSSAETSICD